MNYLIHIDTLLLNYYLVRLNHVFLKLVFESVHREFLLNIWLIILTYHEFRDSSEFIIQLFHEYVGLV
jgi:hypothetical protein